VKSASEYEERFGALVFGRIGVFTLMTFDQKSRNLFWSIFAQTVSVLVRKSAGSYSGEILVHRSARHRVCSKQICGVAKLVLYCNWCALFQFHFSNDATQSARI